MSLRKYLLGSAAACGALALVAPAHAQSSASLNTQIQSLRDQVRTLNAQLENLQSQVVQTQRNQAVTAETVTQIKATPPAPVGSAVVKMLNGEPVISTLDGQNTLALTGRLHLDVGTYGWSPASSATSPRNLDSGINARRARLGVQGKFFGDWGYALIYDFGGSNDVGSSGGAGGIENAFVSYNGIPQFHFTLGYIDVPYTLDEATSSNNIMFMEKSLAGDTATGIAGNDNRSAFGVSWNNDRGWVGVYGTGPTSGTTHSIGAGGINSVQYGATGRATYQLLQGPNYSFHIGGDAQGLVKPARPSGFGALTLKDDPELRVDNTALINTGTIGTALNPVTSAAVYGFETAGGIGSLYGQGEFFHFDVARQGLSGLDFNGGYGEVSYTLTGESRHYNPGCGCYGGISPEHPFSLATGNWGAWEIAARYSVMDLNDLNVTGGKETNYTFGLNWYPNNNMRFMLNYIHGDFDKTQAAVPHDIGGTMNAVAVRSQFAF